MVGGSVLQVMKRFFLPSLKGSDRTKLGEMEQLMMRSSVRTSPNRLNPGGLQLEHLSRLYMT